MLVGVTLPLWAIHFGPNCTVAFSIEDVIANCLCTIGIVVAYIADTELFEFMTANEMRVKLGKKKNLLLDDGIWSLSRHPNYFGEQLWWWSLAMFGVTCGSPWTIVGTLFNSAIMMEVTRMTEQRMLTTGSEARRAAYKGYCARTPMLIPYDVGRLFSTKKD